ncbi:uncharacterized protein LOC108037037 isoform X2 [Drosophila rhopaloa]|uniref:Uncharacterized protein n=1 Tax=Drosophila rhopaloa TaxID=1041015 RepID=A0ABM5GTD3_DRORH|nr:uncharacterized protein LOC108037037 isoform X2 [Drosophila rhopaloa]
MLNELSYTKLKLLFINVFAILHSATYLNVYRLYADLKNVKAGVDGSNEEIWIREIFTFLISGLIVVRFFLCFVGLASNIVAINIYSDQHNHLATLVTFNEESHSLGPDSVDEVELANQNFYVS